MPYFCYQARKMNQRNLPQSTEQEK
uniref:Uncharacterized protein n=1 Tax=Arundo donax TaxID=35708 RepID=A0A0A9GKJ6_ARUDO